MFKLREIKAKSIISKSNLPESDYVINPYVGCFHSCVYCYARFMKRFTGHNEAWGTFVDVKINAPDLIPTKTNKYQGKSIFLSSVTDPYLPLEKKYQLTRKILEKLIPLKPNLGILTKSSLVARDIDLLKQFKNCEVGLTITTLDDDLRKEVEPMASSVSDRIDALNKLKTAGIRTYIFIGPIFPYLTDWKKIIQQTKNYTDFYMFENLNVGHGIWGSIEHWLKNKRPELLKKYQEVHSPKNSYWDEVEKEIKNFCHQEKINGQIYFHH